jgi:hypothetical protein
VIVFPPRTALDATARNRDAVTAVFAGCAEALRGGGGGGGGESGLHKLRRRRKHGIAQLNQAIVFPPKKTPTQREHGSERARGYVSERGRGCEGAMQREHLSELRRGNMGASVQAGGLVCECAERESGSERASGRAGCVN